MILSEKKNNIMCNLSPKPIHLSIKQLLKLNIFHVKTNKTLCLFLLVSSFLSTCFLGSKYTILKPNILPFQQRLNNGMSYYKQKFCNTLVLRMQLCCHTFKDINYIGRISFYNLQTLGLY